MAVHADNLAAAAEIAVRLLLRDQEIEPPADSLGVAPLGMRVTCPQKGQKRQSRQGRVGLPVRTLAKALFAGRTVRGEVVVAFHGRPVVVPRDSGVPAAVVVLMPAQPVESPLDRQLAGGTRTDSLRPRGPVGVSLGW